MEARETFIRNLQFAAPKFKDAGIKLLIEPINTRDMPGFFLNQSRQAIDIIKAVGSDNLFLQYDIYHMQRMEGELSNTIRANRVLGSQLGRCCDGGGIYTLGPQPGSAITGNYIAQGSAASGPHAG